MQILFKVPLENPWPAKIENLTAPNFVEEGEFVGLNFGGFFIGDMVDFFSLRREMHVTQLSSYLPLEPHTQIANKIVNLNYLLLQCCM